MVFSSFYRIKIDDFDDLFQSIGKKYFMQFLILIFYRFNRQAQVSNSKKNNYNQRRKESLSGKLALDFDLDLDLDLYFQIVITTIINL